MQSGEMTNFKALTIISSDGKHAEASPMFALQFVNVRAGTQAEKERNQKIIRSSAMRAFRQKQKSEKQNKVDQRNKATTKSKGRFSRFDRDSHSDLREPFFKSNIESSFKASLSQVPCLVGEHSTDRRQNKSIRLPIVDESPLSSLSVGGLGQFRARSVGASSHVHELIYHCTTHIWPGLQPSDSDTSRSKISSVWLEKAYERPVVMHAMLFGAAVHMDVLRSSQPSLDNPIRLHHKIQTLALLKEELKHPEKAPLDEVLFAILCLAANEVDTSSINRIEKVRSPFNSPLASAQWLDVYGSMTHIPAHVWALRSLVSRRGGLEKIEMVGLAEVIMFSDILGAAQSLSKPYWPLLDRIRSSKLETPAPVVQKLGQGFQDLLPFGINNIAASVLRDVVNLTSIIDNHCRGIKPISDIARFIGHRNTVQHTLLSLPKGDEVEPDELGSVCLYDSIRLAAFTYSAAVTFPLSTRTGVFRKLASSVKKAVHDARFHACWELHPVTLLWILVVVGIAASNTPERKWYVQRLSALSDELGILVWEEVAQEMSQYLWLESACDAAGRVLWMEVINHKGVCCDIERG